MTNYSWYPQKTKWRYALAVSAVGLGVFVFLMTHTEPEFGPRILASFFALVAVFLFIEQDTHIDSNGLTIVREGRLFGRFRVWLWRHQLSEFTSVTMRRQIDPEGCCDIVFVGLRRRNGRLLAVSYFSAGSNQPSVEAERVARSLAETTGLPLDENTKRN